MDISCFSFTDVARRASHLMKNGGAMITLTYAGSTRVMPSYNVMGVAKAALEASVRYLAADLGRDGIRVNALSPGPMRTLAGSVVGDSRNVFKWYKNYSPLKKTVELQHVGGAALYFLSDLSPASPAKSTTSTPASPSWHALSARRESPDGRQRRRLMTLSPPSKARGRVRAREAAAREGGDPDS